MGSCTEREPPSSVVRELTSDCMLSDCMLSDRMLSDCMLSDRMLSDCVVRELTSVMAFDGLRWLLMASDDL